MSAYAILAKRIVTSSSVVGRGPLGVLTDAGLVVEDGRVAWIGASDALESELERRGGRAVLHDVGDRLVTPGLIDAHTHAAWVGSRHDEYATRMAGGDYEAIAKAGGGIIASQKAISAASEDDIASTLTARILRMASLGVTTIEVKSGYGLVREEELKQLRAIARVRQLHDVPDIVPTYLGLHALPKAYGDRRGAFLDDAIALVPDIVREHLANFVDAYVDRNAFTCEEARAFGTAARKAGLGVRLHVGQFSDVGGAALAKDLGASSADHLEVVDDEGARSLAEAGVAACLLPTACFTLRQEPPPIARLRAAGLTLVVASDANPGTSPSESLPLAMAFAVRLFGLTTEETLLGVTRHAAHCLGLTNVGVLREGSSADFVVWDLPHEHALMQPWGTSRAKVVARKGVPIHGSFADVSPPFLRTSRQ